MQRIFFLPSDPPSNLLPRMKRYLSNPPWNIQGVTKKNALLWFYGYNSTLERARNNSRVFQKIQEILYQIDTKIFQFDLLEAEKIGSKDGNPN